MKGISFDELKYKLEMNEIDNHISNVKSQIHENMDVYFIDENQEVFDTMMKDYTGGKHIKYQDENNTDFVHYNDYKNSFLDRFKKKK